MKIEEAYPDLAPILKGARFKPFCDTLYTLAMCRYMTQEQLNSLNFQAFTKPKITRLSQLGYIAINHDKFITIGELGKKLLADNDYNLSFIQKDLRAINCTHALKITDCLMSIEAHKHIVLYPTFNFLIPDACVILRREAQAKILMVEVEESKPNWEEYLLKKKHSYERLAVYEDLWAKWWRFWCQKLDLNFCERGDFCFSVLCFGGKDYGWKGWNFTSNLSV